MTHQATNFLKRALAVMSVLLMGLTACSDVKNGLDVYTDKADAFAKITSSITGAGDSRARVLELMGTPVNNETTDFAGLSKQKVTFTDRRYVYTVLLINNAVVSKSQTAKPNLPNN